MDDSLTRSAIARSINAPRFSFPYAGGTRMLLIFRKQQEREYDILIAVDRGQFLCRPLEECTIRVRFDNEAVETIRVLPPSDGSTDVLFIFNELGFLEKTLASKSLRVEATFFREGSKVFEFQIGGLRWPPD